VSGEVKNNFFENYAPARIRAPGAEGHRLRRLTHGDPRGLDGSEAGPEHSTGAPRLPLTRKRKLRVLQGPNLDHGFNRYPFPNFGDCVFNALVEASA
jgi:hypothetical protein